MQVRPHSLAVLGVHPPDTAGAWLRANQCSDAVEIREQTAFVARLA